jgi:hypothetical protein
MGLAKGTPLSDRIPVGSPYSLNKRSKTVNAMASFVLSNPSQQIKNLVL